MKKKDNYATSELELGVMSTLDKSQQRTIIRAIGVGGGGINAVNLMYQNIDGVTFAVLDSDRHQLIDSPVPNRVLLRPNAAHGQGEKARHAVEESKAEIDAFLDDDTRMVIIIGSMGGDTGTDVAPEVARIAREKGLLTVGIVTIPFIFEGSQKILKALKGADEMRKHVDALFIIDNQCLTEIYNDLDQSNAFAKSGETLTTVVHSLCGLTTPKDRAVSYDFNELNTTLRKGGNAIISSGYAVGEHRVTKAIENALESPLLKNCDIYSSKIVMLILYYNPDSESPLLMSELNEVQEFMINFHQDPDVIWCPDRDRTLDNQLKVTVLASGFNVSYKSDIKPLKNMPSQND